MREGLDMNGHVQLNFTTKYKYCYELMFFANVGYRNQKGCDGALLHVTDDLLKG